VGEWSICTGLIVLVLSYVSWRLFKAPLEPRTLLACFLPLVNIATWLWVVDAKADVDSDVGAVQVASICGPFVVMLLVALVVSPWRRNFLAGVEVDVMPRAVHQPLTRTPLERLVEWLDRFS
jgi:hypothetical protein